MGNQVASQSIRYQTSDAAQQPPKKSHHFGTLKEKSQLCSNKNKKRGFFEVSGQQEFESVVENYLHSWDSVFCSADKLEQAIFEVKPHF